MTYEIKLKKGFFKTQPYLLTVADGQIILTSQGESADNRLVIGNSEVTSICIIMTMRSGEIEIVTPGAIYIGIFAPLTDMEKVRQVFSKEFANKIVLQ